MQTDLPVNFWGDICAMGIRFKVFVTALAVPLLPALSFGQAQRQPTADLIITNAKVWTVDKSVPTAQAVAVLGDRIVAVGSNADVDVWRGAQTRIVDAEGKLLLPGFDDAHVHFISGGSQLDYVQLNDATSAAGICAPHRRKSAVDSQGSNGFSAETGTKPSGVRRTFPPKK